MPCHDPWQHYTLRAPGVWDLELRVGTQDARASELTALSYARHNCLHGARWWSGKGATGWGGVDLHNARQPHDWRSICTLRRIGLEDLQNGLIT